MEVLAAQVSIEHRPNILATIFLLKHKTWYAAFLTIVNCLSLSISLTQFYIAELGRNPNFYQFVARKPKILMLNKSDLIDRAKFKVSGTIQLIFLPYLIVRCLQGVSKNCSMFD